MFFKRLSRSRSNSQSYVDKDYSPHDSKANSTSYDDKYRDDYDQRPDSSRAPNSTNNREGAMFANQAAGGQPDPYNNTPPLSSSGNRGLNGGSNGGGYGGMGGSSGSMSKGTGLPAEPMPDLLTRAFNEAVRPYTTKLDEMECEISDLKSWIEQLEAQRREVHAWIDKRGLRPDVPPNIAQQMDAASPQNPTHPAATLNAQLDRKITIVNFDLHRLQDDLNDSLPTPSFSACMLKFLPDISRLSALPSGPKYAFDLLLKLGGNLNSHGGVESGDEEDLRERRSFYARLDDAMVEIVRGRFREEGEGWGIAREIKRIEKTGAYLRQWGVEPYFPRTLDAMRDGTQAGSGAVGHGGVTPPAY